MALSRPMTDEDVAKCLQESDNNPSTDDDSGSEIENNIETEDETQDEQDIDDDSDGYQPINGDYYVGKNMFKWAKKPIGKRRTRTLARNIVSERAGPKGAAIGLTDIFSIWKLYFNAEIVKEVVQNTNQHIHNIKEDNPNRHCQQSYKSDLSVEELYAFIGLLYMSGSQKSSHLNISELWSSISGPSIFRATMSMQRFYFLLRCLRFDNKDTREERSANDKFAPIRNIWGIFIELCKSYYSPSSNVTIDEQLLRFRGRCGFKMYIPSKPDKYGIKIVMICDSKTYYMFDAIPYIGKQEWDVNHSIPTNYVLQLSESIRGTNRNITMDNWFSSIAVADELHKHGLTMVGTMRKNKPHIPPEFLSFKKKDVLSTKFGFHNTKTLVSFIPKPRKAVILLSSMHYSADVDTTSKKPEIILYYNSTKGGVDTFDQLSHSMTVARKTRRWPLRVFYGMLDTAAINSFIIALANSTGDKKPWKNRRHCLQDLARSLVQKHIANRSQSPYLSKYLKTIIADFLGVQDPQHQMMNEQHNRGREQRDQGRCILCPRKNDRKSRKNCIRCHQFVCSDHSFIVCTNCKPSED